jgi:hypothetical protein
MADAGRLRTVAALTVVFIAACTSATAHPSATSTRSPTVTASTHPLAALAPVTSKELAKTIYLTFDDGPNPTWSPGGFRSGRAAAWWAERSQEPPRITSRGISARPELTGPSCYPVLAWTNYTARKSLVESKEE